jgi:hypothetical protein
MIRVTHWLCGAVLILSLLPGARAESPRRLHLVSRTPSAIGVEARQFPKDSDRGLFYQVRFAGSDLGLKKPLPEGVFEIPTAETGVYELTILSASNKVLWKQDLFAVTYSDKLNDPSLRRDLALGFAPVVLFHPEEEYYPSSIPYILNQQEPDPELDRETFNLKVNGKNKARAAYDGLSRLLATYGDSRAVLNTAKLKDLLKSDKSNASATRLRLRTGSAERATLYYSILEDPHDERAYVNYHFLYAFDPKSGTAEDPSTAGHAFDRESLTVVLNTGTMEPEAVVFGAHLPAQTMGLFSVDGDLLFKWDGGRVQVPWAEVHNVWGHPVAAVAKGSHGIYPMPGLYAVLKGSVKLLKEPVGGNRVLIPPALDQGLSDLNDSSALEIVPYEFLDLGLDEATSDSWNCLLVFSGSTVDVLGSANAKFPPFTGREANPMSYARNAVVWPVDELPRSARGHLDLIVERLGLALERTGTD